MLRRRRAPPGFHDAHLILGAVHSVADVERLCASSERELKSRATTLAATAPATLEGAPLVAAVRAFDWVAGAADDTTQLFARVHPDAAVRTAASACEARLSTFVATTVHDVISVRFAAAHDLDRRDAEYVTRVLAESRINGSRLSAEDARAVAKMDETAASLVSRMRGAIARSDKTLRVEAGRLRGLPPAFRASHPADASGFVTLSNDANDLLPVQQFAEDRGVAHELFRLTEIRGFPENVDTMGALLETRRKEAVALGFPSWADYAAASRMVGTRARTETFLTEVEELVAPINARFRSSLGLPTGARPLASDGRYFEERARRALYLDTAPLAEYFETDRTLHGMLDMIGEVYGLRFVETRAPVWSDDVLVFDVSRTTGEPIGRVYYDIYARPGKTPGTGSSLPVAPRPSTVGAPQLPYVAVVTSVAHATTGAPSLLSPEFLTLLLHETGHAVHLLLRPAQSELYLREFDFFDVPSQAMEAWASQPAFLARVARHYQTGAPLPDSLGRALAAEHAFRAWQDARRFLIWGLIDIRYHGESPPKDTRMAYVDAFEHVQPYAFDADTHPELSLFIPVIVYAGNGHALAWGQAIAADLLGRFEERGFFDRDLWATYTAEILASDAPAELRIERFLGRRWSTRRLGEVLSDAFPK